MKKALITGLRLLPFAVAAAMAIYIAQAMAMEVSFEEDPSVPVVYINVAVKDGFVTDPSGQSGITNFMGEMLMRGTKHHTKEQIDQALDQMGGSLDVEARAESMLLRGAVLTSQLDPYLKLLNELITESTFPDTEIKKLKSEIQAALLEELGHDSTLASRRYASFLFRGHPYGKPMLGTLSDISNLTVDQIKARYDKLFRDKLLLVVGTGDAKTKTINAWASGLATARPGGELPPSLPAPTNPSKRRLRIIDKPDRTQDQVQIGQIGLLMTSPEYFPLYVVNHAFGGDSFSARLFSQIRIQHGWSYGTGSVFRVGTQPRSWTYFFEPTAKDAAPALAWSLDMVEKLKVGGITEAEFSFAKQSLVNGAGFSFNTPQKRVENKLIERTLNLPDGFMKSYGPKVQSVTLDEANKAAKDFFKPDQLSILVLGTAKDLKEPLAKAAGLPVDQVEVIPYTEEK